MNVRYATWVSSEKRYKNLPTLDVPMEHHPRPPKVLNDLLVTLFLQPSELDDENDWQSSAVVKNAVAFKIVEETTPGLPPQRTLFAKTLNERPVPMDTYNTQGWGADKIMVSRNPTAPTLIPGRHAEQNGTVTRFDLSQRHDLSTIMGQRAPNIEKLHEKLHDTQVRAELVVRYINAPEYGSGFALHFELEQKDN